MAPSFILDACALSDRRFTEWLAGYRWRACIPSVVYMERCRRCLDGGHATEELDALLRRLKINVLWFDMNNARIAAGLMSGRKHRVCRECGNIDWIDAMVASYCNVGGYIVTNNKADFPDTGGFEGRVLTTGEVMGGM